MVESKASKKEQGEIDTVDRMDDFKGTKQL